MAGGPREPLAVMPMLAASGPLPDEPGWAFEFSWDGVRSLADVGTSRVRLIGGGNGGPTAGYPELDVLPALVKRRVLLDGKIVALDACGRPNLSRLQHRMNVQRPSPAVLRRVPVAYYVFDLLRLDDRSTLELPYRRRRELLEELELGDGPMVRTPYFLDTDGPAMLATAAQYGLHGVVAKRLDSPYRPGRRSRCWMQATLRRTQEVVIGGWVPGTRGTVGSPGALGSLLAGVPTDAGLRYVGRVGLGFTDAARIELRDRLAGLAQPTSPFVDELPKVILHNARWVVPTLLGEVSYRRWTTHGRLSHPTWAGLRHGKHPAAVQSPVMLTPSPVGTATDGAGTGADEEDLAEAVRRAQAEVQALRLQVDPHFLYNALAAIAAMVRTDPPRARELLMEFAGFTRYSFRRSIEFTTLDEELENIERYLALEQARLEERLQVTMQVAVQMLPIALPFLALQSVVENAVRNGIEVVPGGGTLAISALDAGADCLITVAADGLGANAHADLDRVDDRLRLAFGDGYGLVVDSADGTGGTVSLRVPKVRA
ncbi:MAG TPA: histidine kinase [Pseudonocardiaceae bacterium]|jgi:DNA ligase D-like protein (predicted ligase)